MREQEQRNATVTSEKSLPQLSEINERQELRQLKLLQQANEERLKIVNAEIKHVKYGISSAVNDLNQTQQAYNISFPAVQNMDNTIHKLNNIRAQLSKIEQMTQPTYSGNAMFYNLIFGGVSIFAFGYHGKHLSHDILSLAKAYAITLDMLNKQALLTYKNAEKNTEFSADLSKAAHNAIKKMGLFKSSFQQTMRDSNNTNQLRGLAKNTVVLTALSAYMYKSAYSLQKASLEGVDRIKMHFQSPKS